MNKKSRPIVTQIAQLWFCVWEYLFSETVFLMRKDPKRFNVEYYIKMYFHTAKYINKLYIVF